MPLDGPKTAGSLHKMLCRVSAYIRICANKVSHDAINAVQLGSTPGVFAYLG